MLDSIQEFLPQLHTHVYQRLEALAGRPTDREPSHAELQLIRIERNRIYVHKVMRVNYTSYDMRRNQDSINPRTHPDIMMLAPLDAVHPYLYARVSSIFHVNAYRLEPDAIEHPEPQLLHVLWVRWYDLDTTRPGGFDHYRPHRLKFADLHNEPFGFISPGQVLRGVHIYPASHYGHSLSPSLPYCGTITSYSDRHHIIDEDTEEGPTSNEDWKFYYVGM